MAVLVTGGAGYIGSHTCVELLNEGHDIIVIDNLSNSKPESIKRIKEITGRDFPFYEVDICDYNRLEKVFAEHKINVVIHFAGLKAVGESNEKPLLYYRNNVLGSVILFEVMNKYNVKKVVFSSSATVYAPENKVPMREANSTLGAINPYGRTKLMIEDILRDLYVSDNDWSAALLRYFNPFGAHESGRIGEDPNGIPNNLMPYVTQVAIGKLKELKVFGNDYSTPDGTGVRDYIHVVDLARGHIKALEKVMSDKGVEAYNLGTGKGYSVLEMITAFEKVSDKPIPYSVVERRPGDIGESFADPSKAKKELGWNAEAGIDEMCRDSWKWQVNNPNGYDS